jgi:hypothetical protein
LRLCVESFKNPSTTNCGTGICWNFRESSHGFLDGNKMTGAASTLIFLSQNGCEIKFDMKEFEDLVCEVTQGKVSKESISRFLSIS